MEKGLGNSIKIGRHIIDIPVMQGGMGVGISRSRLAGAVAKEGGIGVISAAQIGYDEPDYEDNPLEANLAALKKHIRLAREAAGSNGLIGVNIMVATRHYERYVRAAADAGAELIVSGAGLPTLLPKLVEGSASAIAPIVSSVKAAQVILKLWERKYNRMPDLIVIEGPLAGGHLGFDKDEAASISMADYAPEVAGIVKCVHEYAVKYDMNIPVFFAGGIYDRQDAEYCMNLGVDGIQVASRFVTTEECDAADAYKQAYINAKKEDIIIVKSPVGMPGRAINNKFIKNCNNNPVQIKKCYQCINGCKAPDIPYCIAKALINAVRGNLDEGLIFCGANAYRCNKIEKVSDVIRELWF